MAKVLASITVGFGFNINYLHFNDEQYPDDTIVTSTQYDTFDLYDSGKRLYGSGFREGVDGLPSSGRITSIHSFFFGDYQHSITGIAVQASDYARTARTYTNDDDRSFLLKAFAGNDTFSGSKWTDLFDAGAGDDDLFGEGGDDSLDGMAGNDHLDGGLGADLLVGGSGNDIFIVDRMTDKVYEFAGEGRDTVFAESSYALAVGVAVEQLLAHEPTAKTAINLTGNDTSQLLKGNAGANTLDGGGGNDTLTGLQGADSFVFRMKPGFAAGLDTITDFNGVSDHIKLFRSAFSGLKADSDGTLKDGQFKAYPKTIDADDRILYDKAGNLFYDPDGSGKKQPVAFAHIDNHAKLTADDLLVV